MANKNILLIFAAFFSGLIIGGIGISVFLSGHVETNFNLLNMSYLANLERKANEAYSNESPEVASWALTSLIETQKSLLDQSPPESRTILLKDLVLSYTRLALTYQKAGNDTLYQESIDEALALAKKVYPDDITDEHDLINFARKTDGL